MVYKRWKISQDKPVDPHPDEETLVCFLEDRLSKEENQQVKAHLVKCDQCAESLALNLKIQIKEDAGVPVELVSFVKNMPGEASELFVLEIALKFKEKLLELIHTTGDTLVGQELIPAPLLRSRSIKNFKDEIIIFKDFKNIRVEVKIENKDGRFFDLTVVVRHRQTQKVIKDLRVTLAKDELELESYLSDSGMVVFEHVLLGKYSVEISSLKERLASILIDIKNSK